MSSMQELAKQNPGLISGWRLSVTLQPGTPLKWLLRHWEVKEGASYPSEEIPTSFAMWMPIVKTWAELGIPRKESSPTMASAVGQIPVDGGDLLPFLIKYRSIVELVPILHQGRQIRRLKAEYPEFSHLVEQANRPGAGKLKRFPGSYKRHLRRLGKR
ncbi:hypothetical protein [Sinorhizobium sp. BJ1]|uniref:hypothetical protein n=1 Tax=Sinorhizobium sp. BJ1 TaxID=2035455 RepID=UPI000BE85D0C|nr:hypothetical protein [Sinorhizobium sp. BJ1]PDT82809.1 hypothetical protein CO676_14570 [Sinorhizobium sp. BJ1]